MVIFQLSLLISHGQTVWQVNLNLGGDEVPGHGNGGLLWCGEVANGGAPRWVPAPLASVMLGFCEGFAMENVPFIDGLPGFTY